MTFELAQSYITALTGHPDTICDWRCIHDTNKATAAHNMRGTISEVFARLQQYNQGGWGIFVSINAMDGNGRELANVQFIRTHVVDLDDPLTSAASYQQAIVAYPQPHFAVQSSPNKYHLYWLTEPYTGNDFYQLQQRKLAQLYNGDKSIIDSTRVLRVPGFYHLKAEPFLSHWWSLHPVPRWTYQQIGDALVAVNMLQHFAMRSPLGDIEMKAPSLEWLRFALYLLNPNELSRQDWLSISAAFKQAGWLLADEHTLFEMWNGWCAQYGKNDAGENAKLWNSVRDTEVGWAAFQRRTTVKAYMDFGENPNKLINSTAAHANIMPAPAEQKYESDILSSEDCMRWFKGCIRVTRSGEIFSPRGRYMSSTGFNMLYGGKHFIITQSGKTTDDPWKAATRSTLFSLPEVDHIRFLPTEPSMSIIYDSMKRPGLNTYIPVHPEATQGDVSMWLNHVEKLLPNEDDRHIFYSYIAHNVKYPGHKIPWAIMVQSMEGGGKTVFAEIMKYCLGSMYVYQPKAPELVSSGSKFNAWMRGKLCIIVDEIKVDERRELIEILKPMITDKQIEVQAKGVDQEMEDNVANWIFFSNYKDAIPISRNGRRYAILFSALQTILDIQRAGMNDTYFNRFFEWLEKGGGYKAINYWLLNYPIERGALPVRAPHTSSHNEALRISRSPMQIAVEEALQDDLQGFRGGYISNLAVTKRVYAAGVKAPAAHSIRSLLESMGYHELGRSHRCYLTEDMVVRPIIYINDGNLTLEGYGPAQGYEF